MSVEQTNTIDFIGSDRVSGHVNLGISEHLPKDDPKNEHLLVLQEKINSYLAFIEGGQLYDDYPLAKGKNVVIQVIGKYPLNAEAKKFYTIAGETVKNAGFHLEFKLLND